MLNDIQMNRRSFVKGTLATAAVAGTATMFARGVGLGSSKALDTALSNPTLVPDDPFAMVNITLNVNGQSYAVAVQPRDMLVNVIRENLNFIGTKRPCNRQECGGCTVLIDNVPYYSCTYLATRAQGHNILTVEGGIGSPNPDPVLVALQTAWVPADASQCGYCQPGRLLAATALLKSNPNPTVQQIQAGLEGVLCRCGTYLKGIDAVLAASQALQGGAQA